MTKHAIFLSAVLLAFVSTLSNAQTPVPFVNQPLVPDATAPGGSQFTLTVNGTGFVSNSAVNWNGNALATQFVSGAQLTATVPAANIATAGTASVTVVNPPPGGGTSNVVFFPVTANVGNSAPFALASSPFTGPDPQQVAVGDFNGDNRLDLAVANVGVSEGQRGSLSILLGDGTGNFTLASSPPVGTYPCGVVTGDFNGDGILDLAVSNFTDGTLSILLGDGTGNFTLASSPGVGGNAGTAAVGDFNGDGKLDLAVQVGDAVSILLGDGTGNFTLASSSPVGSDPWGVAVGDFNGDGKLDLAVTNYGPNGTGNTASILLGDGTGNFTLASSPFVGQGPVLLAVADFNGDGKLDLAVPNCGLGCGGSGGAVSILLGDGAGNFTLASSPATGWDPMSVAVGDFNGDGKLDLAVANQWSDSVSILLGDGTGNFALASSPGTGAYPWFVAVGDFNGDGKLDLAAANYFGDTVSILLGVAPEPAVGLSPASLTFGPQLFGTSSYPQPVTLTNIGSAALDLTRVVTSANFSQTNNCPRQLPPGKQCTANVVFTPHNVNTINGTMAIYDNAPDSPQTIPLSGVGFAVTLLPPGLDFGDQPVGTTSQPQTVTLTNYAPKAVTIFGGDFAGRDPHSFRLENTTCGHSLPGGASCTVSIVFAPKGKGSRIATFEMRDNGGLSPQMVALSGTGTQ